MIAVGSTMPTLLMLGMSRQRAEQSVFFSLSDMIEASDEQTAHEVEPFSTKSFKKDATSSGEGDSRIPILIAERTRARHFLHSCRPKALPSAVPAVGDAQQWHRGHQTPAVGRAWNGLGAAFER